MMNFFDIPVFKFVNVNISNPFFNLIAPYITELGGMKIILAVAILCLLSRKKETKTLGVMLFSGLALSYFAVGVLKTLVARPRPYVALTGINMLMTDKGFSFPSGHATRIFMAATLLSWRFKRPAIFYSIAALVALSRVYLGVHYPTDIIAGAILGTMIGLCLVYIVKLLQVSPRRSNG